jgi:hypothetical protein
MADHFITDDGLGRSQPDGTGTDTSESTSTGSALVHATEGKPDGLCSLRPGPLSREGLEDLDGLHRELAGAVRERARRGPTWYRLVAIGAEWADPAQASIEQVPERIVAR